MSEKYYLKTHNIIVNDVNNDEDTNVDAPVQAEKGPRIEGQQIPQAIKDEPISSIIVENYEMHYKISQLSSLKEENSVSNSDDSEKGDEFQIEQPVKIQRPTYSKFWKSNQKPTSKNLLVNK